MPDFLCKSAHRVSERQGGAIVVKLEAALDAACRRVKFPIGNLSEIGCTLFARERFDAASARNAGTLRERRHHNFTFWRLRLYPPILHIGHPVLHEHKVSTVSPTPNVRIHRRGDCGPSSTNLAAFGRGCGCLYSLLGASKFNATSSFANINFALTAAPGPGRAQQRARLHFGRQQQAARAQAPNARR